MSLQLAAQHLSSQGRGSDSTLVHMSPREVKSLNELAMAHGGQLSINPQTGLPEAGFLSSILPMVAGAALMAAGVPAGYAALGVGAGTTLLTGSLEKGLMAGLGAYGGANLGEGLLASGTDIAPAVLEAQQAQQAQQIALKDQFYNPTGQLLDGKAAADYATQAQQLTQDQIKAMAGTREAVAPGFFDKIKTMGGGIGSLGQEGGLSSLYQNLGGSPMSLLKSVGSAAAPAIGEAMTPKKLEEEKADKDMGQRYGFSMNPTGGQQVQPGQDPLANTQSSTTTPFPTPDIYGKEQRYFSPSYTKLTPEEAKSMYGYAEGGPTTEVKPATTLATPPADNPALAAFKLMQAQRAAQPKTPQYASTPATGGSPPATTPTPTTVEGLYTTYLDRASDKGGLEHWNKAFGSSVDADEAVLFRKSAAPELAGNKRLAESTGGPLAREFNEYLKQTVGAPNQLQAPATPPPTTTNLADSGFTFDPITQRYSEIKGTLPADGEAGAEENAFIYTGVPQSKVDPKTGKMIRYDRYGSVIHSAIPGVGYSYAGGGMADSERMPASSYIGSNTNYPQSQTLTNQFSTPTQIPMSKDVVMAGGGISHLGDYSDGGRLLRGPGDGVSDSIPAMIGKRQPARLADGEFVVPARIVSELGNGSTEAGARKLYAMMDRIQKARGKTVGKGKVAKNSRSEKHLPA